MGQKSSLCSPYESVHPDIMPRKGMFVIWTKVPYGLELGWPYMAWILSVLQLSTSYPLCVSLPLVCPAPFS